MTVIHTFETVVVLLDVHTTPSRLRSLLRALNLAHTGREAVSYEAQASAAHKASHQTLAGEEFRKRRVRVGLHLDGTLEILELL